MSLGEKPTELNLSSPPAGMVASRAKEALARAWKAVRPDVEIDPQGYVPRMEDNLITGVTPDLFLKELEAGDGDELKCKIRAVHSSSALVVNTFARWKHQLADFSLAGEEGFVRVALEVKCRVIAGRRPANLDLVAVADGHLVAVESKLLEPLRQKKANFPAAYDTLRSAFAGSGWHEWVGRLRDDPQHFLHLDAAQLVKHCFGLRQQYPEKRVTLLYLYWEPVNVSELPAYALHRREIEEFARSVADEEVQFAAQSYADLWQDWTKQTMPDWLPEHLGHLLARYRVLI